jgi:CDP-diacylglycerol--glycerol-3-phosphate 3-phosphatidyltransferase
MKINLANKVSLLRVLMIPLFLAVMLINFPKGFLDDPDIRGAVAAVIFVIASLTDFIDGYIARKYNMVTDLGKFLDPLADKLLIMAAMLCLIRTNDSRLFLVSVIIILGREFIVTGFRAVAASHGKIVPAGILGKLKTNVQIIMVVFGLLDIGRRDLGFLINLTDTVLIIATVIITVASGAEYIYKNKAVLEDRPIKRPFGRRGKKRKE